LPDAPPKLLEVDEDDLLDDACFSLAIYVFSDDVRREESQFAV
jgi:hypothetical protein